MRLLSALSLIHLFTALTLSAPVAAQTTAPETALPADMRAALAQAKIPVSAVRVWVQDTQATQPRLQWQAQTPFNPASLMKLLTTSAGLDLLGPAWQWSTPVWLQGRLDDQGVLNGDVVIQGAGDPKIVTERLWLLMRRVQQLGVQDIRGDIVLDRSHFAPPERDPGDFDGESLRPYNTQPDALLVNFQSIVMNFTADPIRQVARISLDPPLDGVTVQATVPLNGQACGDWRTGLRARLNPITDLRFAGSYPADCGDKAWPLAFPVNERYTERALLGMWRSLGGRITGRVRDGRAPPFAPNFQHPSPALAEVVRDINKYSNNVMAQQLFLTLGLQQKGEGSPEAAQEVVRSWLQSRFSPSDLQGLVVHNGSGLSRQNRVTAQFLARLLNMAWTQNWQSELKSSLPISGTDGTLRRYTRAQPGRAHLKTGTLRDVAAIAGYALGPQGQQRIVVAAIEHPNAPTARPALEALVQWVSEQP